MKESIAGLPAPMLSLMRSLSIVPLRTYIRFSPVRTGKTWLYDHIAGHFWWLETKVLASTVFGTVLDIDAADIVGKHIYYFGRWEPILTTWLAERLRPGDTFVDVGANVGYFSLLASQVVGNNGKVIAIEALPDTFEILKRNIDRNNLENVRAVNVAAWNKEQLLPMFVRPNRTTGTATVVQSWASQWHLSASACVQAKPLSLILRPEELRTARLMKVDVEGAECQVMADMTSWLDLTRYDFELVIELARGVMLQQGWTFGDVVDLFKRHGFTAYRIANDYRAATCVADVTDCRPERIEDWPAEDIDQIDLVLSRRTGEHL